jgi:predicted CoA-substrate-specific enzyme activase
MSHRNRKGPQTLIYAGCDLGIISAKAAIIDNNDMLALEVLPHKGNPRQAAAEVMDKALARAGLSREQIAYCVATGFGKKAVPYADEVVGDLICQHRAIREINTGVRTVINVGGHSYAAFNIDDNGCVSETAVTDKCAAGTGRFIEIMADALEIPVEEMGRLHLNPDNPVNITNQCVILAESEVISLINDGYDRFDIYAGVAASVAGRIISLVKRVDVIEEVALIGGVAKNILVVAYLERKLGLKFAHLDGIDPQTVGALGAALVARDERRRAE